jgi:hypothetical protein
MQVIGSLAVFKSVLKQPSISRSKFGSEDYNFGRQSTLILMRESLTRGISDWVFKKSGRFLDKNLHATSK